MVRYYKKFPGKDKIFVTMGRFGPDKGRKMFGNTTTRKLYVKTRRGWRRILRG